MSRFRAAARVREPGGQEWEIYAYKVKLPARDPGDAGLIASDSELAGPAGFQVAVGIVDALVWIIGLIPGAVLKLVWDVPLSTLRAARSDEWTIEAVTWFPVETHYRWQTTRKSQRAAVSELKHQLATGKSLHLRDAVRTA